jgi:hypothetical protein
MASKATETTAAIVAKLRVTAEQGIVEKFVKFNNKINKRKN